MKFVYSLVIHSANMYLGQPSENLSCLNLSSVAATMLLYDFFVLYSFDLVEILFIFIVSVNCPIDEAYQTTMKDKAVQTMVDKFIEAKKIEISPTYYDPGNI